MTINELKDSIKQKELSLCDNRLRVIDRHEIEESIVKGYNILEIALEDRSDRRIWLGELLYSSIHNYRGMIELYLDGEYENLEKMINVYKDYKSGYYDFLKKRFENLNI